MGILEVKLVLNDTMAIQTQTQSISVKGAKGADIRRFPFATDGTYEMLQKKLAEVFGGGVQVSVFWQDEQDDKVTIKSTDELQYAINIQKESKPLLLRLVCADASEPDTELLAPAGKQCDHALVSSLLGAWHAAEWPDGSDPNEMEDEASLLWSHDVAVFENGGGDGP